MLKLAKAQCTQCGALLDVDPSLEVSICVYCNMPYIVDKAIHNYNLTINIIESSGINPNVLLLRADQLRMDGFSERALEYYEKVLERDPWNQKAHWGEFLLDIHMNNCSDRQIFMKAIRQHTGWVFEQNTKKDDKKGDILLIIDEETIQKCEEKMYKGNKNLENAIKYANLDEKKYCQAFMQSSISCFRLLVKKHNAKARLRIYREKYDELLEGRDIAIRMRKEYKKKKIIKTVFLIFFSIFAVLAVHFSEGWVLALFVLTIFCLFIALMSNLVEDQQLKHKIHWYNNEMDRLDREYQSGDHDSKQNPVSVDEKAKGTANSKGAMANSLPTA